MNGSPSQPPTTSATATTIPTRPWLPADLVSALRQPSALPNPFLNAHAHAAAAAAHPQPPSTQSPFALHGPHPHQPSLPSPYHNIYNPLTANYAAAHAAAAALGTRAPFGLDPTAFLQRPYRYLLPPTTSGAANPGPASAAAARFPLSSLPSERSASESEVGLGPGRPPPQQPQPHSQHPPPPHQPQSSGHWRRPLSPPPKTGGGAAVAAGAGGGGGGGGGGRSSHPTSNQSPSLPGPSLPTQPYYPSHFMRGTVIQLASGELKRVEELNTEDFVRSANLSSALKMDSSTVVRVEEKSKDTVLLCFSVGENKVQVSVEATVEHPFFVIGQGWSSCSPERTRSLYGLPCQRLQVGDICISLTQRDATSPALASTALAASLRRSHVPDPPSSEQATSLGLDFAHGNAQPRRSRKRPSSNPSAASCQPPLNNPSSQHSVANATGKSVPVPVSVPAPPTPKRTRRWSFNS